MSVISFTKKDYTDNASSGSGLVAADMNKIEKAIVGLNNVTTALLDAVSPKANTGVSYTIEDGRKFENTTTRFGDIIFIGFNCSVGSFSSWEKWNVGTAPIPIGNIETHGSAFYQTSEGATAPVPMDAFVTSEGLIYVQNKSGLNLGGESWLFTNIVYATNPSYIPPAYIPNSSTV